MRKEHNNMNIEKRTAVILKGKIIAIFKSADDIVKYLYDNYMYMGLSYEDIPELDFSTIYVEL